MQEIGFIIFLASTILITLGLLELILRQHRKLMRDLLGESRQRAEKIQQELKILERKMKEIRKLRKELEKYANLP